MTFDDEDSEENSVVVSIKIRGGDEDTKSLAKTGSHEGYRVRIYQKSAEHK